MWNPSEANMALIRWLLMLPTSLVTYLLTALLLELAAKPILELLGMDAHSRFEFLLITSGLGGFACMRIAALLAPIRPSGQRYRLAIGIVGGAVATMLLLVLLVPTALDVLAGRDHMPILIVLVGTGAAVAGVVGATLSLANGDLLPDQA